MMCRHTVEVTVDLEVELTYGWDADDPSTGHRGGPEDVEVESIYGLKFQFKNASGVWENVPEEFAKNIRAYFDDETFKQVGQKLNDYAADNPPEPDLDY